MTCAGCRKAISGAYITAMDRKWHSECFKCAGCRKSIGQESYYQHTGKPYHGACYHQQFSPRCALCKGVITTTYITALGKSWHDDHFQCADCGKRLKGLSHHTRQDKPYCEKCFHNRFSPRCAVCDEPMTQSYLVNSWGDKYCKRHNSELPKCFSCDRLICTRLTKGGQRYEDGRTMCNGCWSSAVTRVDQGQHNLQQVRRTISHFGLDIGKVSIPLRLVNQDQIRRESKHKYAKNPAGLCSKVIEYPKNQEHRYVKEILILWGLPREHFEAVAAHELCHAWLFLNNFPSLDHIVEEGICELSEYLYLKQQRTGEAARRVAHMESDQNDDPVYGAGFHAAHKALGKRSLPTLLSYVRQYARLP